MIRLAYAQGVLSNANLNPIQLWALDYHLRMDRRNYIKDEEDILENQAHNLDFMINGSVERWKRLFSHEHEFAATGEPEIPITDPRKLDQWFERMATERGMTAGEAERIFSDTPAPAAHLLGYAQGEGRKV